MELVVDLYIPGIWTQSDLRESQQVTPVIQAIALAQIPRLLTTPLQAEVVVLIWLLLLDELDELDECVVDVVVVRVVIVDVIWTCTFVLPQTIEPLDPVEQEVVATTAVGSVEVVLTLTPSAHVITPPKSVEQEVTVVVPWMVVVVGTVVDSRLAVEVEVPLPSPSIHSIQHQL